MTALEMIFLLFEGPAIKEAWDATKEQDLRRRENLKPIEATGPRLRYGRSPAEVHGHEFDLEVFEALSRPIEDSSTCAPNPEVPTVEHNQPSPGQL